MLTAKLFEKNIFSFEFLLDRKIGFVGDGVKKFQYEISHGTYVIADDELALPNLLVHLPSQNYVIMDIYMEEELNERVNCGDLDDGGENARYSFNTMREVELDISHVLLGADGIEQADEGGVKSVLLNVGDTIDPDEVKVFKAPYDWVDPSSSI